MGVVGLKSFAQKLLGKRTPVFNNDARTKNSNSLVSEKL